MGVKMNIITLLHKGQKEKDIYLFRIDVVLRKKVDDVLKMRLQENFDQDPDVLNWNFELQEDSLKRPLKIQLQLEGGLILGISNDSDDTTIIFDRKSKFENRYVSAERDGTHHTAFMKFRVDGKLVHKVTITNIPTISTSTSSSFVDVSGPDSLSNSLQNTSLKEYGAASASSSICLDSAIAPNSALTTSVVPTTSGEVHGRTPTYLESPGNVGSDDSPPEYHLLLNEASLKALAAEVSPTNFSSFVISLGLPLCIFEEKRANNPTSIGQAKLETLMAWKTSAVCYKEGESGEDIYRKPLNELLKALRDIGRNDIRSVIKRLMETDPRALGPDDFHH